MESKAQFGSYYDRGGSTAVTDVIIDLISTLFTWKEWPVVPVG